MAVLNSNIIICKSVKLDRGHINVLNYTTQQMLALCNSNGVYVASRDNYSFIRKNGNISVDFTYAQCVQCNYMAFQNPDYDNKWFFAWIDSVEYKGDRNVEISFTVDNWSTWYDLINWLPVFVEREHVNSDVVGANMVPEPVNSDATVVFNAQDVTFSNWRVLLHRYGGSAGGTVIAQNKMLTPLLVSEYVVDSTGIGLLKTDIDNLQGNYNGVVSISMFPKTLIDNPVFAVLFPLQDDGHGNVTIDGYAPVNNKLFTYPYNYIDVDNGHSHIVLHVENFLTPNAITFNVIGTKYIPNSDITIYPIGYEGYTRNPLYSLSLQDTPQVPFCIDSYKAWLAQKSNGQLISSLSNVVMGAGAGFAVGGTVGGAVGALGGVANAITSIATQAQEAKDASDSIRGNSTGSNNILADCFGFFIKQIGLRADVAKGIDTFFSQHGYQVNTVKIPNITGRQYWNYIKVNGVPVYGAMPEDAKEDIIKICNSGVTIWHDHSYLGNYLIGGDSAGRLLNPIV